MAEKPAGHKAQEHAQTRLGALRRVAEKATLSVDRPQHQHDPKDVEWMARFMCEVQQLVPERMWDNTSHLTNLEAMEVYATRALDYMQANGCKVTTRESYHPFRKDQFRGEWHAIHDAAPLTPRDK